MKNSDFDFGAMVENQMKGVKKNYKFGRAFDETKSIERQKTFKPTSDLNPIKTAWEEGAAISGIVEKEIKGGYEVKISGVRAFCPFSQIDKVHHESSDYIGRKFDFLITDYSTDERGENIIISRRALQEIEAEALKEATLANLTEGETLNGTITRVLDFGAFVDLGGLEGLLPAREVAWEKVADLKTVLTPGAEVTVKIIRIDREEGKVSLSRRACMARSFKKSDDEIAAEKSAAEIAAWMNDAKSKNANVGSLASAFDALSL